MEMVSYVVTVYNKSPFLPAVIRSIELDRPGFNAEVIFVDDGSSDGSIAVIEACTAHWAVAPIIISQPNSGASAATNAGLRAATSPWVRLLDGDDLIVPGSTHWLLDACERHGCEHAYGNLKFYESVDDELVPGSFERPEAVRLDDGLSVFIRNCAANSSSILVARDFYWRAGGCDERLVSPDQALFLRLFNTGKGAHLRGAVALKPRNNPGRLSGQVLRSRYESVLALYHLVTESPGVSRRHAVAAYRRALARAYRYNSALVSKSPFSPHLLAYLLSKVITPKNVATHIYKALGAFTEDGRPERPDGWKPAILLRQQAKASPPRPQSSAWASRSANVT